MKEPCLLGGVVDPRSVARNLQDEPDSKKPQETSRDVPKWWHHMAPFLWRTLAGKPNSNQPVSPPMQEAWRVEGSTLLPLPEVTGLSQSHPPSPNCCRWVRELLLPLHAPEFLYPRCLRKLYLHYHIKQVCLWEWLSTYPPGFIHLATSFPTKMSCT